MKKFAYLMISSLLLTGCNKYQVIDNIEVKAEIDQEVEQSILDNFMLEDEEKVNTYYEKDEDLLIATSKVAQTLYKEEGKGYYGEVDTSGYNINLEWEMFQNKGILPQNSKWTTELDKVFPGIQDFMIQVGAETINKQPQSKIINNAIIRIKPTHLYQEEMNDYGYSYNHTSYMSIENNPIRLTDAYFKQLEAAIAKDKFIVSTPYVEGDTKLLRFTTPAFNNRNYMSIIDYNGKESISYYEKEALGYQLYVKDNELQKIRVVFNKLNDEVLDHAYLEPLLTWCQNEWQMDESEMLQVEQLIDQVIEGKKGKKQGKVGNYNYNYHAKNNSKFRYYINYQNNQDQETEIELCLTKGANRF